MKITPKNEVYKAMSFEQISFVKLLNSNNKKFNQDRDSINKDLENINYKRKMYGNFFNQFKEIFSIDGISQIQEGQVDYGILTFKDNSMLFGHSEMGIYFGILNKTEKNITAKDWIEIKTIFSMFCLGVENLDAYKALSLKYSLENSVKEKDKNKKIKV